MNESGCILEHPVAAKFHEHIMTGEWELVSTLHVECKSCVC